MTKRTPSKSLQILIQDITPLEIRGKYLDVSINRVTADSRKVNSSSIFLAIKGLINDGHDFIADAIESGVRVIVLEEFPSTILPHICYIQVGNTKQALSQLNVCLYDYPDKRVTLVGVTGTNGKTSVSTFLHQLYSNLGYTCGLISTVEILIGEKTQKANYTTPDAESLIMLLDQMVSDGCSHVFMEVSSHALHQGRTWSLDFDVAIFTNLSRDHLDYHKTLEHYRDSKKILFDQLPNTAIALLNKDDKNAKYLAQNSPGKIYYYSMLQMSDYKGRMIEDTLSGLHLAFNDRQVHTSIIGTFNAYNLLASYSVAMLLGEEKETVITALSEVRPVKGRMELIYTPVDKVVAIVDYAHTPDALKNLLQTVRASMKMGAKMLLVFGCGGDRDKGKREEMGALGSKYADELIITSDNPRSESPNAIIADIMKGVDEDHASVFQITEREQAIRLACQLAKGDDVVVVAGKGHESYQELNGERIPFSDHQKIESYYYKTIVKSKNQNL